MSSLIVVISSQARVTNKDLNILCLNVAIEIKTAHWFLLAREPRDCPDQILKYKTGTVYVKDREKKVAYLRLFSQVSKRELKPLARTPDGARAHRYR